MLILLPLNVIGQSTLDLCKSDKYPKTKVVDGDTVVLFTQAQEKCIYIHITEKEECNQNLELSELLIKEISNHVDTLKSKINLKDLEISKYKEKTGIDDKTIMTLKEKLIVEEKIQNVYINQLKKVKTNRTKIYIIGSAIIGGLSTALIVSLLN